MEIDQLWTKPFPNRLVELPHPINPGSRSTSATPKGPPLFSFSDSNSSIFNKSPVGGSCRYTSWSRPPTDVDRIVEECHVAGDDEEDDETAGALLEKLSAMPPEEDVSSTQKQNCSFSWKELEQSCKKLDAANIKISQIDLSCVEEDIDFESPLGPSVLYNFQVDGNQEGASSNFDSSRRSTTSSFSSFETRTPVMSSVDSSPGGSSEFKTGTSTRLCMSDESQRGCSTSSVDFKVISQNLAERKAFLHGVADTKELLSFVDEEPSTSDYRKSKSHSFAGERPDANTNIPRNTLAEPISEEPRDPKAALTKLVDTKQSISNAASEKHSWVDERNLPRTRSSISAYARGVAARLGLAVHLKRKSSH